MSNHFTGRFNLPVLIVAVLILTTACLSQATVEVPAPLASAAVQTVQLQTAQGALGGALVETETPSQAKKAPATQKPPSTAQAPPTPAADSPTPIPRFSTSSASQDLPTNVMEEILYFGGMGGGGGESCDGAQQGVISAPYADAPLEIFAPFQFVVTCGWKEDEPIQATVTTPAGRVSTVSGVGGFDGSFYFEPEFLIDDPLGTYQLRVQGESGAIETTFQVVKPARPLNLVRNGQSILYGFQPNERVRLFAYNLGDSMLGKFAGWQEYQVDADGKLAIELAQADNSNISYYAIGEISGDVNGLATCSRALPSRLRVGMQAQVIDERGLSIAEDLTSLGWSDTLLPKGTVVEVVAGPTCIDIGGFAWQVATPDGQTGFVMENGYGEYFLSPDIDPSLTADAFSCAGAMPPRLQVGMSARVTFSNGLALRVRSGPGFSQKIHQQLPEGTEFNVIDGPVCAEGAVWWQIQASDGIEGWVAEGQDGAYYIEPWD